MSTGVRERLLMVLVNHVGRSQAIGMGELFEAVYGEEWSNRINDTRRLRREITALRAEGMRICSTTGMEGGGYYLASAGSELEDYCKRLRKQGLKKLAQEAKLRKIGLPELLGQIRMNMGRSQVQLGNESED